MKDIKKKRGRQIQIWLRKDEVDLLDRLKRHIGTTSDLAVVLDALKHMEKSIKREESNEPFIP